ncbi:MAG: hypothetical protein ABMB14_16535 [Myxococcota bacterium]
MSASKGTKWIQGQMTPTNATYTTMLLGPVMLAYGSDTLRVTGMLRALAGSFGAKVRYRTFTARVEEPDAWVDSATVRSAAGEFSEDFSLAAIGSKLWIQPALAGATTAGAAGAEAFAAFQGWTKSNGVALATQTFEIEPDVNATQNSYLTVGKRIPALGLTGLMFAAVVRGVGGTLKWNVASRLVQADPAYPGAWVDLLGVDAQATGNTSWNSGNLAITPGVNATIETALKIPANNARGTITLIVAGKY